MEDSVPGDAGIVHQHIHRTQFGRHRLDGPGAVVEITDIALDHHDAKFLCAGGGGLLIAGIAGRNRHAVGLQTLADRPANATRSAGNKRNPAHVVTPNLSVVVGP